MADRKYETPLGASAPAGFVPDNGSGEIRTHGTLSRTHTFQACSLNHSATDPSYLSTSPPPEPSAPPALARRTSALTNPTAPTPSTNGQGEIRTHDPLAGTPVFETGAFNHSATCPEQPLNLEGGVWCVNECAPASCREKVAQQQGRVLRAHAALHLRPMVQAGMPQQIADGAGHPRLVVPRPEHDALHAGQDERASTHGARLQRHVERPVHEPPAPRHPP